MKPITAIFSAALVSTAMMAAPAAFAQEAPAQDPAAAMQAEPQLESSDVSDEQLQSFVDASEEMFPIAEHYSQELAQAGEDEDRINEIGQQADEEMFGVIESHGLEVEDFVMIGQTLELDPELAERAQALVQE